MPPGKIMRICSLLGALVHTGKDEIKRWCNEGTGRVKDDGRAEKKSV